MRVMFPLMNLIITKWLLVYVLENKHNFYVIHFLSLTVMPLVKRDGISGLSDECSQIYGL